MIGHGYCDRDDLTPKRSGYAPARKDRDCANDEEDSPHGPFLHKVRVAEPVRSGSPVTEAVTVILGPTGTVALVGYVTVTGTVTELAAGI
jgi:hypothetical protein